MPLTSKGKKIKAAMVEQYGEKKGTSVFYASINKGNVKGAEKGGGKVRGFSGKTGGSVGGKVSAEMMQMAEAERARIPSDVKRSYQRSGMSGGAAVGGSGQGYGGKVMMSPGYGGKVMGQAMGGHEMGYGSHASMGMGGKVMSAGGVSTASIDSGDGHPAQHAKGKSGGRW